MKSLVLSDLTGSVTLDREAMNRIAGGKDEGNETVYIFSADVLKELQPVVEWIDDGKIAGRRAEDQAMDNLNNAWNR